MSRLHPTAGLLLGTMAFALGCGGRGLPPPSRPDPGVPAPTPEASKGPAPAPAAEPPAPPAPESSTIGETSVPEQQVDRAPEVSSAAIAMIESGRSAAARGDLGAATDRFEEAVDADPKVAEAHYNLGVLAERRGVNAEALRQYEQALDARPEFGPAVVAIGELMIRRGDATQALAFAQKKLSRVPESNTLGNALNRLRLAVGRNAEVIRDSKRILRRDEKNAAAMKNLAIAYLRDGKAELALAILGNAGELDPADPDIPYWKAKAHLRLESPTRARLALEKAVGMPGGASAEAHNSLGLIYHEAGDFVGAEGQFRLALQRWPDMLAAHLNLANALKGQQKFADADGELRAALKIDPRSPDCFFNLGILYLDGQLPGLKPVDRLEKALAFFDSYKQYVRKPPTNDPIEAYIAETRKRVEVEKKRAEQARSAPKEAPEGDGGAEAQPAGDAPEGAAEQGGEPF